MLKIRINNKEVFLAMDNIKDKKKKGCDTNAQNSFRCADCGAINYAYENEMPGRCMKCDGQSFTEL